ncbi:polysaccharide deacetylase family protein [uncultured Sphingomonas sp.]|uniref:polysaccharide deacetylase family protein n=1 Tax=uncultured Sphingomonas sp. TaxID=158754 RepID=UPI00261639D0|nr:polysaccharide deacetylase family protein [uncultured Sphingomonas sp.]
MVTPVFLTVDTEFAWRHHRAGLGMAAIYERSIEPMGVGLSYQLEVLRRHALKATFFIDPMPAEIFGIDPVRRMVDLVLAAGQEVQLHCHPHWQQARPGDRGAAHDRFQLYEYDRDEQQAVLARATELLMAAGAPRPVAFRAGSYAANDDTLAALAALGFTYDSSHNGAEPQHSRITLPARQVAPVAWQPGAHGIIEGIIEVPVTVIEDRPGHLRTFQICALSTEESCDALEHAAASGHGAVTIVSHSFELANRSATRANAVHVRRFEALCETLHQMASVLPTRHFAEMPDLRLGQADQLLGPDTLRTRWRQAEQLWSNLVEERQA